MPRAGKHLRAAALSDDVSIGENEQVMKVVAPKGSNLIEVRAQQDAGGRHHDTMPSR